MSKKTKKTILNIAMVAAIVIVLTAGLMTVGTLKGWFGEKDLQPAVSAVTENGTVQTQPTELVTENKLGSASIERKGVAYSLDENTRLRDGDLIETMNGSSIDIVFGESRISLDENCSVAVGISETGEITLELKNGGIFADVSDFLTLRIMDREVTAQGCVFSASAPYGSANLYVFENELLVAGGEAVPAGSGMTLLPEETQTAKLSLSQLNAFDLEKISAVSAEKALCFTAADVQKLSDEREAERQEALQAQLLADENAQQIEEQRKENKKNQTVTDGKKPNKDTSSADTAQDDSLTCTITIRCDTILDNMGDLTEGKNKYVPANGVILAKSKLTFEEGETVFDVLNRACKLAGIQIEYSWTPMYDSYYIEGLNHLYEFDCGEQSGWMYKVNGWFPNYGCSSYKLKDGDAIVWCYTCNGLGADVGGGM